MRFLFFIEKNIKSAIQIFHYFLLPFHGSQFFSLTLGKLTLVRKFHIIKV